MNLMKKLLTALRGGVREVGEAVIDANSMRIYEQEIEEAKQHIAEAKESLTTVMAQEMRLKRNIKSLQEQVNKHENYVREALDKGDEPLALQVADKIANFENEQSEHLDSQDLLVEQIGNLKDQIREGERIIADHERQLSMVKTTDSVQRATIAITENVAANHSQLHSAKESLERIRKRQQHTSDKLAAGRQLTEEESDLDLHTKLKEAGIISKERTGESVLERLRKSS